MPPALAAGATGIGGEGLDSEEGAGSQISRSDKGEFFQYWTTLRYARMPLLDKDPGRWKK